MANTNTQKIKKRRPRGTGSIYYNKSRKRFMGETLIDLGNGKTKRKTVSGKTKTEVSDKLREIEYLSIKGEYIEKDSTKLCGLIENLLDEQLALNEISGSTYDRKLETLKMLSGISEMEIQDISEETIKDFFKAKLYYAQSTIQKIYQLLNWALKAAIKKNLILDNPMSEIKVPKSKKKTIKVRSLTIEEQAKLIGLLKEHTVRYSDIMLISLYTGMRGGEVCALNIEDINFKRKTILVSKTVARNKNKTTIINDNTKTEAGTRVLHINDDMVAFLKNIIGERTNGRLFSSSVGKILTTQLVNNQFLNIMKKDEIIDPNEIGRICLHSLRHTYATRCIESGMPAKALQHILGHKDISTTLNVYCDCFEEYEKEHLKTTDDYLKSNNLAII